jgi:hypothetical protein
MDYSFEKNTRLDFLSDCHEFFKEKYPTILKRMTAMDNTVGNLFLLLNRNYAHDSMPLTVGSEELSKCLRDAFTQPQSGTPLVDLEHNRRAERHTTSPLTALANVAVAAAAGDQRCIPMPDSHHQPYDSQAWTPGIESSASGLNTNALGLENEGTPAVRGRGSVSHEVGPMVAASYRQDVHRQWQMYAGQNPETIHGPPAESHASVAAADQLQANASGLRAGISQQQLFGAMSDMTGMNPEACGQCVQPQWLPRGQAHQNTMPNPAPAGSLVCFNEADIAMANNSEAITAHMNDVWPAEWWDEFLDQGV